MSYQFYEFKFRISGTPSNEELGILFRTLNYAQKLSNGRCFIELLQPDAWSVTGANIPENAPVILSVMCDGIDSGPKRSRYFFYQPSPNLPRVTECAECDGNAGRRVGTNLFFSEIFADNGQG